MSGALPPDDAGPGAHASGHGTASRRDAHDIAAPDAEREPSFVNRSVAASLRQRLLVVLLALGIVGARHLELHRLPVDAYPDLSPPIGGDHRRSGPATPRRRSSG